MQEIIPPSGGATNGSGEGGADQGALIKDATVQTFMTDVIEASRDALVLVDFWAPWCGPCKQLTPALEKAVRAAGGQVRLVKVNVDENQTLAAQMNIQSIPAVFAFRNGQPVDGFMGALPDSELKAFIERALGGAIDNGEREQNLAAAQEAFNEGDIGGAARLYAGLLQADPQDAEAIAGLARCYLEAGELDKARQTLALAGPAIENKAEIASVRAALELAEKGDTAADVAPLRAKLEANPGDHQARLELALALNSAGEREAAVDELLEIVRRDREWNDDAARKQLVEFFDAWGPADEATLAGRRRLSSILFA